MNPQRILGIKWPVRADSPWAEATGLISHLIRVSWEERDSEQGGSLEAKPEGSNTGGYLLIDLPEAEALGP